MENSEHKHEVISRAEAKAQGLTRYFTGKACANGSIDERQCNNGACLCRKCRDTRLDVTRRWRSETGGEKDHLEKNKIRNARYRDRHRERITEANRIRQKEKYHSDIELSREISRARYMNDPDAARARVKRHYKKNKNTILAKDAIRRIQTSEYQKLRYKRYRADHPHIGRAQQQKRKARKLHATPAWAGEFDDFVLTEAAHLCVLRAGVTGYEWHIDHMIPLHAKTACGLHCAENLQVIPGKLNLKKGNKLQLTERGEWLR